MTVEEITKEALLLPSDARAALADQLVESLDPAKGGPISEAWTKEALQRRDEVRSGRVKTIPGKVAIEMVRRSLQG